jgi:hypothetical protein
MHPVVGSDRQRRTCEPDRLDSDFLADCRDELAAGDVPTLEEARRVLSKIPGSLVSDFAAERDERRMLAYLFDTRALAKHYHKEVGSSSVDSLLATSGTAHFVSGLTAVELHSVLAKKVREGALSSNDLERLRRRFLFDVHAGTISILRIASSYHGLAQQLIIKHGPTRKLLTLDALQLAVPMDAHACVTLKGFVVADLRLEEPANAEGLPTVNPGSSASAWGP